MKTRLILFLLILYIGNADAQFSQADRDSINKYTWIDYNQMLGQLNIDQENLRPGPSGNPNDKNAANSIESRVKDYDLPPLLLLKNGVEVKTPEMWWNHRRKEIVEDLEKEMYGRLPENIPDVEWRMEATADTTVGNYPVKERLMKGIVDNSKFPKIKVEIELLVVTPANNIGPVPMVIHFGWIRNPWNSEPIKAISLISSGEPTWQEQLISKGWGYAILVPGSIQADNGAGLTKGIIGLTNEGRYRKPDEWGSLRAWAWGASKAIDFFETDPEIDAGRIAIEGLSRYGKAAVVAMAFEPRISLGFIGSSGAGGTKILRRNFGEQLENLASSGEYHWFCGNFIKYKGPLTVDDLPVDAHSLIALCAPRPVFISSGSPMVEGNWVDGKGMFLGGFHADKVYNLLGKRGLGTSEFPVLGYPLVNGDLAFRQHAGGHSTGPNWSIWIAWASKYWN